MQKGNKTILENIVALFSIKGMDYIIGLLVFPYLVRILGVEKYGLLVFAQSFSQYFILVTNYAFSLTAPRDIASHPDEKHRGRIFVSVLGAKLLLLGLCSFIYALLIYNVPIFSEYIDLYLCVYLCVIGDALFPVWFFQGIEKMKYITYVNIAARLLVIVAIFACVKNQDDYILAAFLQSIVFVVAGIFSFGILAIKYQYVFIMPQMAEVRKQLVNGWQLFISTIAVSLYTGSNIFFLGLITSNTVVGYFSGAQKIMQAVKGVIDTASTAIYPQTSRLITESREETIAFLKSWLVKLCAVGILLSSCLCIFAEPMINMILGSGYELSISVLRLLSFIPFIVAITNIFAIQTLIPFGWQHLFSRIVMWSAILNLIIIFPLIYLFEANGVAFAMLLTEFFVAFMSWYLVKKQGIHYF